MRLNFEFFVHAVKSEYIEAEKIRLVFKLSFLFYSIFFLD
jgi:hypothetical protein